MAEPRTPFHIITRDYLRCRGCGQELLLDDPDNSPWVLGSAASDWTNWHCGKCGENPDDCDCDESRPCGSDAASALSGGTAQPTEGKAP